MKMNAFEFSNSNPNSKKVNEVLKWLRQENELEKFAFVWNVLEENQNLGLCLVKSAQLSPIHLRVIFEKGLVYSDASSINDWMKAVVENLGHRELLKIIRSHISITPLGVYKTLYWLPSIFEDQYDEFIREIKEISKEFSKTHPHFSTTTSIGSHPCIGERTYLT